MSQSKIFFSSLVFILLGSVVLSPLEAYVYFVWTSNLILNASFKIQTFLLVLSFKWHQNRRAA